MTAIYRSKRKAPGEAGPGPVTLPGRAGPPAVDLLPGETMTARRGRGELLPWADDGEAGPVCC